MPVAVNCRVSETTIFGVAGVTAIDCSVAAVTLTETVSLSPRWVALRVTLPTARPVTRPVDETLAVARLRLAQMVALSVVRFVVLPSEYVPVRLNWMVLPAATDGLVGVIATEDNAGEVTVSVVVSERPL